MSSSVYGFKSVSMCQIAVRDHAIDSNDNVLVATTCFNTSITSSKFRLFRRFDKSICNLYPNWFKIETRTENFGGFDFLIALIIVETVYGS